MPTISRKATLDSGSRWTLHGKFSDLVRTRIRGGVEMPKSMILFSALAVVTILSLFLPVAVCGANYMDMAMGKRIGTLSTVSFSMGGAGLANPGDPFRILLNPSLAVAGKSGSGDLEFAVTGILDRNVETRSFPVWDSFESYLTDNIYSYNANYYPRLGAALSYAFDLGGTTASIYGGHIPLYDFDYDYTEQIRDIDSFATIQDELLGLNSLQSRGSVDAWTIGTAIRLPGTMKIGIGVLASILNGDIDAKSRIMYEQETVEDIAADHERAFDGKAFGFGLTAEPRHDFTVSCAYRGSFELTGDAEWMPVSPDSAVFDTTTIFKAAYPHQVGFGIAFRPRNQLRTTVSFDLIFEAWSDFYIDYGDIEISDSTAAFDPTQIAAPDSSMAFQWLPVPGPGTTGHDIYTLHVGVEHIFRNEIPFRFGFSLSPHPADSGIRKAAFSAGTGWRVGAVDFSFGIEASMTSYRMDDIFPDTLYSDLVVGLEDRTDKDRVKDFAVLGMLTARFRPF